MTSAPLHPTAGPARRSVVAAVGAAGSAAALTACSGSGSGSGASAGPASGSAGPEGAGSAPAAPSGSGQADAAGQALAAVSDIPEGGGVVFADRGVVVTQPVAGEFKAFSATCTHRGCAVKNVADGVINCPCHDSNFSVADGSVRSGPAREPLPAVEIAVDGDAISLV